MPALGKIDAVSRPMVDPQFANALANGLHVTKMPAFQSPDPHEDVLLCPSIAQAVKPSLKNQRLGYDQHMFHIRDMRGKSSRLNRHGDILACKYRLPALNLADDNIVHDVGQPRNLAIVQLQSGVGQQWFDPPRQAVQFLRRHL